MKGTKVVLLAMPILAVSLSLLAYSILSVGSPVSVANYVIEATTPTEHTAGFVGVNCANNGHDCSSAENLVDWSNNITITGRSMIMQRLFFAQNVTEVHYIAVGGNTTPQTGGLTSLSNEWGGGLNRTNGLCTPFIRSVGVQNITCSVIFTSTTDNVYVNTTGLFNQTSGVAGESTGFFAEAYFTNTILQTSDTLNVSWYTWVS